MAKSILQNEKECFLTGAKDNLHEHHIFGGSNRKASERHGFKVWLRADWHVGTPYCVHNDHELNMKLKRICQAVYEGKHSREEFMAIIGKNYLD